MKRREPDVHYASEEADSGLGRTAMQQESFWPGHKPEKAQTGCCQRFYEKAVTKRGALLRCFQTRWRLVRERTASRERISRRGASPCKSVFLRPHTNPQTWRGDGRRLIESG